MPLPEITKKNQSKLRNDFQVIGYQAMKDSDLREMENK